MKNPKVQIQPGVKRVEEKKTYTIFQTDLKKGADKEFPKLSDIQNLTKDQIFEAWSILYIRPDNKQIFLKNRSGVRKKLNRFQILKETP
jgi:hypothetical protein